MRSSFFEIMSSSILRYFSTELGKLVVHPNLGSFGQFFIIKTNLSKVSIPNQQCLKLVMTFTILIFFSIFFCELTMPMNCHATCEILRNCYSCFAHHVKGLNAVICIAIFLKNDSSTLRSPNVTSLVEAKGSNTPSSSVTDQASSTLAEVNVRLL